MNIRIALLFTAILIATSSGVARAALQPLDPAHAPVAAVDRFSDKAGTLLVRSNDKRLPGPNEPIDFDTPPLNTLGRSPTGEPALYYHLDVQSTTPAPVYIFYRDGEDKPVASQLDIIDTLPGDKGYNDFRQVWKVTVPKDYMANTIVDVGALKNGGYKMEQTHVLRNMPVVPDKSTAKARLNGENAALQRAWYQGQVAKFFSFDEAPLSGSDVPLSPIYVTFNVNPGVPNGGPGSGFKTEPGSEQSHNVPATLPGDPGYSPLWLVSVYDNIDFSSVHDLKTALKAKVLGAGVATVNCPIVFVGS